MLNKSNTSNTIERLKSKLKSLGKSTSDWIEKDRWKALAIIGFSAVLLVLFVNKLMVQSKFNSIASDVVETTASKQRLSGEKVLSVEESMRTNGNLDVITTEENIPRLADETQVVVSPSPSGVLTLENCNKLDGKNVIWKCLTNKGKIVYPRITWGSDGRSTR